MITKKNYLSTPVVSGFVDYFAELIDGKPINHQYQILDLKLPKGYEEKHCERDGSLKILDLKDAYKKYWWDRKDFNKNKHELDHIATKINDFNNSKHEKNAYECIQLVKEVFEWGGVWHVNARWVEKEENLIQKLVNGSREMQSDSPNLNIFKKYNSSNRTTASRMNAGYTKYYSLACQENKVIIYDSRVGAALGLLTRKYLEFIGEDKVPKDYLDFRWAIKRGENSADPNYSVRDPSCSGYKFTKLGASDQSWAECNIKANWIISEALNRAKSKIWGSDTIDTRMIEAALFTLGYSLK